MLKFFASSFQWLIGKSDVMDSPLIRTRIVGRHKEHKHVTQERGRRGRTQVGQRSSYSPYSPFWAIIGNPARLSRLLKSRP
jgi:hypothetical protein